MTTFPDHSAALAALVGQVSGHPTMGPHLVNEPMIVHWAEAMGDTNPVYVDEEEAKAAGLGGIIAPFIGIKIIDVAVNSLGLV